MAVPLLLHWHGGGRTDTVPGVTVLPLPLAGQHNFKLNLKLPLAVAADVGSLSDLEANCPSMRP